MRWSDGICIGTSPDESSASTNIGLLCLNRRLPRSCYCLWGRRCSLQYFHGNPCFFFLLLSGEERERIQERKEGSNLKKRLCLGYIGQDHKIVARGVVCEC
ncbi:hypothetical protein V6N13_051917 [Hibiscus sabdariffa]